MGLVLELFLTVVKSAEKVIGVPQSYCHFLLMDIRTGICLLAPSSFCSALKENLLWDMCCLAMDNCDPHFLFSSKAVLSKMKTFPANLFWFKYVSKFYAIFFHEG